jgi:hypothetical protein
VAQALEHLLCKHEAKFKPWSHEKKWKILLVQYLLSKLEALSSSLRTKKKKIISVKIPHVFSFNLKRSSSWYTIPVVIICNIARIVQHIILCPAKKKCCQLNWCNTLSLRIFIFIY